jgi:hypothetical protein
MKIISLGIISNGTGRINATSNMTNQSFLNLKLYLENAKPVNADTTVWAKAISAENQMELKSEDFNFNTSAATFKLSVDGFFGSHSIDGSITSLPDINVMDIIRKIGSR